METYQYMARKMSLNRPYLLLQSLIVKEQRYPLNILRLQPLPDKKRMKMVSILTFLKVNDSQL